MPVTTLIRLVHGFSAVLGVSAAVASAQPKPAGPQDVKPPQAVDYERLAGIFAPPGTPSIKGKSWVAVDTGPTNAESVLDGWLVEDGAKEVKLLDRDGEVHRLRKPAGGEKRPTLPVDKDGSMPYGRYRDADRSVAWKVRPADLTARAKKFLADGIPVYKEDERFRDLSRGRYALRAHVIDAARYAHFAKQSGQEAQAAELYAHASRAHTTYTATYRGGFEKDGELYEFVANQVASGERNSAIFGAHHGTARADLQRRWERVAGIAHHQYRAEAREMVKHYQSLVDEDRRWVEPDAKARAGMTVDQKAAYWLYHLRDLAVGQATDPGTCNVFGGFGFEKPDGDKANPNAAVELKKLGFAALPHLIAHLDDARPTRCKGHWRSYSPDGHYLLRYGDCCRQVFEAVTGHTIASGGYPIQDGKGTECKAAAERWWRDFQKKGERQVLIEGTAAGTRDSPRHAGRLAEKYPDAALAPIILGARASTDASVRAGLISAAATLKDAKVVAFLREEAAGPHLDSRVRAATALVARGDPGGPEALLRDWKQLSATDGDRLGHLWTIDELVRALTNSGDSTTVRAMGDELPKHPVYTRSIVIRQLAEADRDLRDQAMTKEVAVAIEDLLAKLLTDREEESSGSSRNGKAFRDPMLGDLAAEALAGRLREPKLFDITAQLQVRERQRVDVMNVWRLKRGKEPLPVPPPRTIAPAPDATMQPLVQAMRDAKSPAEREKARKAIEDVGLPALPAVRKFLDSLPGDHPARGDVQALIVLLALVVAEVRFADDSIKPTDAVRKRVELLRNRPVTGEAFMGLLRGTTAALPAGVRGIKLTLERVGDDRGALLLVTLVADRPPQKGLSPQLSYGSRLEVGGKSLGGGTSGAAGFGGKSLGLADIDWGEFTKNLRTALKAQPEEYILIHVHCAETR